MNRKIYLILFALLAWSFNLKAQTAVIESITAAPGESVSFDITVNGLGNDVGAVSLFIGYDPNVLTFTGTTGGGQLTNYFVNNMVATSQIGIQWTTATPMTGENIDGTLLTLNFNYSSLGGVCPVTFDAGCEFADIGLNSIAVEYTNGLIEPDAGIATITASEMVANGGSVPITLTGNGFLPDQVAGVELHLEFDPDILTYTGYSSYLPGVMVNANNTLGILGIVWTSVYFPQDLNDLFMTLNFNFNGTGTSDIVFTGNCEIAYIDLTVETVSYDNGKVSPSTGGPILDIGDVLGVPGNPVTVPVVATGFPNNVASMTLNIGYNPAYMTFTGATSSVISNFIANASNGVIGITWTNFPSGQSIDGTLLNLNFDYAYGSCPITFEGGCEITDTLLTAIYPQYIDGSVTQTSTGPEARLPVKTGTIGQPISFPVKVKNFTMDVGAISLFVGFDGSVLTYTGHTAGTLTGYYINAMGANQVGIQWSDYNGLDIDGLNGDDTLLTLNFMYNGGECPVTFNAGCEFAEPDITSIPVAFFDGAVILGSRFNIKAFLEGPFKTTTATMNVNLNSSGYLPLAQPYSGAPWNYPGTESVTTIPNGTVVDWVLVEVRETAGAASTATAATMVARQAAFLLNDGTIVDVDGESEVLIPTTFTDNVYVVIYHRNHLAMMSANPVPVVSDIYTYDFTGAAAQAYTPGTQPGQKSIGASKFGMYAADGDASGRVQTPDRVLWSVQYLQSGYKSADYDLSGSVQTPDRVKWSLNYLKSEQVP